MRRGKFRQSLEKRMEKQWQRFASRLESYFMTTRDTSDDLGQIIHFGDVTLLFD